MLKHSPPAPLTASLLTPLRHTRFRQLWLANLISNLGTWTQTFAAAWLIATVSTSAATSTLVQTATYVPLFLFTLFAGVIADAVHKPKFLFFCNLFMSLCACAMAVLVISGHSAPGPVLALTFCLGAGAAFTWPAWTAAMAGLVEAHEVESAATLNNLSYNVAAIVGPALGGVLFSWVGAGALFLVNAISFVGLLAVYWAWWRESGARPAPPQLRFGERLREGWATALGCVRYRNILINVGTVFFASIAFAALLPVFVKDILRMNSGVFGLLMGSLGVGAVGGALLLPTVRRRVGRTRMLAGALVVYGIMLVAVPFLRSLAVMVPLMAAAGMAWSATVSTLNAAAQLAFPPAVRARTLSIYLFVMAGGYTLGSLVWGHVADRVGVQVALAVAGGCMIVNALALLNGKQETAI